MIASDSRRDQLRDNLAALRSRIGAACADAGRNTSEVTLIAVTKLFPATDAATLAELGVADLGENRDQEASSKAAEVRVLTDAPVRWHFLGRLQSNKARSVARYAHVVHSVDRLGLIEPLAAGARTAGRDRLPVLVQLSLDAPTGDDTGRGGLATLDLLAFADEVARHQELALAGVMAIAPLGADPDQAFGLLARLSERLRESYPEASMVSAGMSGDLESAIRHGATHVRVGTALLGRRKPTIR